MTEVEPARVIRWPEQGRPSWVLYVYAYRGAGENVYAQLLMLKRLERLLSGPVVLWIIWRCLRGDIALHRRDPGR